MNKSIVDAMSRLSSLVMNGITNGMIHPKYNHCSTYSTDVSTIIGSRAAEELLALHNYNSPCSGGACGFSSSSTINSSGNFPFSPSPNLILSTQVSTEWNLKSPLL